MGIATRGGLTFSRSLRLRNRFCCSASSSFSFLSTRFCFSFSRFNLFWIFFFSAISCSISSVNGLGIWACCDQWKQREKKTIHDLQLFHHILSLLSPGDLKPTNHRNEETKSSSQSSPISFQKKNLIFQNYNPIQYECPVYSFSQFQSVYLDLKFSIQQGKGFSTIFKSVGFIKIFMKLCLPRKQSDQNCVTSHIHSTRLASFLLSQ